MKKLEAINDTAARTCGEIKKKSFSSHVDCYVSTGFCDLSAKDKLQIFWPMRTSFVHPEVFSDAYSVAQICFSKTALSPEALNVPK